MISSSIKKVWAHFREDLLFRNSVYLILTTVVMGGLGFIFWLISTRIFNPEEIGLGTTMVSTMSLISLVSLFGFNNTLIRFLPNSKNRNGEINTAFWIVTLASIFFSIIYIILIPKVTPKLYILRENYYYILGFIIATILSSINSLTDSVFIAYRKAQYNLITDGFIISISKLILPIFFVSIGAYGVFASSGLATSIGMLASIFILIKNFNYKPSINIEKQVLKKVFDYSFNNYIGSLLSLFPGLILPIIIVNKLGAKESGYFFMCFMIINLLYTIASSVSQSLFAEGSYGESQLLNLLKKSLKIILVTLLPASIILAIIGPFILGFFGEEYRVGGTKVIILLSLFSPIVALYNIGNTLLKIRRQMKSIIFTNAIYAISICLLSYLWVSKGLSYVAISWIIGNFIAGIISFIMVFYYRHLPTPKDTD